jgi:hypothetical protein
VRNSKQHFLTVVFVGCLWLALILGCTRPKESSNSGQTTSPATSPTNTATTSSSPARSATNNSLTNASSPASTAGVTMANFNRLQNGMTYTQVVKILGKEGEESSVMESGGVKIVMYKWDADEDGSGARLDVFFKNGKLDRKLQFALK